jgi:hypothetical protein
MLRRVRRYSQTVASSVPDRCRLGRLLGTQTCSDPTPGGAKAGSVVRDAAHLFESGEDKPDRVVAHAGKGSMYFGIAGIDGY